MVSNYLCKTWLTILLKPQGSTEIDEWLESPSQMRTWGKGLRVKKFGRKNPIKLEAPRFFDNPKYLLQKNLSKTPRISHPQVTENGFKIRHSAPWISKYKRLLCKSLKNDYLKLQVYNFNFIFHTLVLDYNVKGHSRIYQKKSFSFYVLM